MRYFIEKHTKRPEFILKLVFYSAFLLLALLYVARPPVDADFWWHLKTGEVMVHTKALLSADPFAFTGDGAVGIREKLILQGYWLWQVLFYGAYAALGFDGITLLDGATLGALLCVLGHRMRKERIRPAISMLLLSAGLLLFARMYYLERPQVFSFLFCAVLAGMIEAIRRGDRPSRLLFPLMILWANCHAGFFFGDLLLAVFCVGACWEYRNDRGRLKSILLWAAGGALASLCSPTSYYAFFEMFNPANKIFQEDIIEYRNTFWFFKYSDKFIAVLWISLLVHVYALAKCKKRYFPDVLLFILIAVLSVMYNRMSAFYLAALLPGLGYYLNKIEFKHARVIYTAFSLIAITLLVYGCYNEYDTKGIVKYGNVELGPDFYPKKAVEFIKNNRFSGNIYNDYDWGGYLIWTLGPQLKVFIDGRSLDAREYKDYFKIDDADTTRIEGIDTYRYLLNKYKIEYVLQKHVLMYGGIQPLMQAFIFDPSWIPVYLDENAYIFVRSTGNADIIEKYGMEKVVFLQKMLLIYHRRIAADPKNPYNYSLLAWLGQHADAQKDAVRAAEAP